MACADLREELNCCICLSIYTDPVTLACGHNFCQVCIGSVLDTQEGSGVYTCPECRETFNTRPALQRNLKLRNIMTLLLPIPVPATKTCLLYEASLCDKHLEKHSKSPQHVLMEPTISPEKRKCYVHKKFLEYYCNEDAVCVCGACCAFGVHKGHQVELLNEASEKKKVKLRNVLDKLTSKRKETERRVQRLKEHKEEVQERAAGVRETVTALIRDIREQLEVLEKRVLSEVTRQEEKVLLQVSDLIQQLEKEKDELSRKMSHIEELSTMTDPLLVLQREDAEVLIVTDVKAKRGLCEQEAPNILLDVNTACCYISVSGDRKTATYTEIKNRRPYRPERFVYCGQVLSTNSFTSGRHYWEVETSESGNWCVGLAYPSIEREGEESDIGGNNKSWGLYSMHKEHFTLHNYLSISLTPESSMQRLGISLDYEAGRLSFYELCDPIRHLHTFTATFTDPFHVVFWVSKDSWDRIRS
ncbi:LOW QUALITY PROTEIN: E3 ubiquitin/ISG15 ligase TRIM25-like [Discoglossus pictus]